MGVITGYLTIPDMSKDRFYSKVGTLEECGLEVRLFDGGVRKGKLIGPNGILFSGKADLKSSDIMGMMYGSVKPKEMRDLIYDVSGKEDFDVRELFFGNFESYFSLRVKVGENYDKILSFNRDYLQSRKEMGFRFVEHGYVVYEYLTDRNNLGFEMGMMKRSLKLGKFGLDEGMTTIIGKFFRLDERC